MGLTQVPKNKILTKVLPSQSNNDEVDAQICQNLELKWTYHVLEKRP